VLEILCSGGTPISPKGCFYFNEQGTLFVNARSDSYAVVIGRPDFSDAQNSLKIDHLIVNNAGAGPRAGGLQLNYVLSSEIFAVADAAGGGPQASRWSRRRFPASAAPARRRRKADRERL
jgi:hypothetical protein